MTLPSNSPKGLDTEIVVSCLKSLTAELGYPPTVQELGSCLGLKSKSSTHYWLRKAVEEGRIEWITNGRYTKAIRIV